MNPYPKMMKALNPAIRDGAPVILDGAEVERNGRRYHYAGHYTDRVDLDGRRLSWEWYDITDDLGAILGRVSPYVSSERIKALFTRLFRDEDPHGFTMAARWPSGTDRTAVNIAVPADIVAASGLTTDDELRIKVYSVGPHPVALGRRLFHLSQTGAAHTAVIPLSVLSQYKASMKYDAGKPVNEDGEPIEPEDPEDVPGGDLDAKPKRSAMCGRGPRPGEYVALVVDYDLRTRRRELADIPKQTEDPDEPLKERSADVEAYADAYIIARGAAIIKDRMKKINELAESLKPGAEERIRRQLAEVLATADEPGDKGLNEIVADLEKELRELPERRKEAARELERLRAELWKQETPRTPRPERWAGLPQGERYAAKKEINDYIAARL